MATNEAVIKTVHLSKIYKDFWRRSTVVALEDLNIEVYRGEIFGFLGPNGSGKTTTMKLLLGLIFPSSGEAQVLGKPASSIEVKQRIGFLPEESYLYGFLNADETLDFFGRIFTIPSDVRKKRIDELLTMFGIAHARHRRAREYSKGMQRRLSFCQALINDPEVVFLDEPTSGLDPISSRQMKDLIVELKRRGKTVFMSSHLLADVQDICDRIAILYEGKLRKYGPVKDLLVNKDLISFTASNLSPEAIARIKETIAAEKGTLISCDNSLENLEAYFMKTIRESKEPPPKS